MIKRSTIAALSLSAAAIVGIAQFEGYEPVAKPPVPGDVDTGGFGSTRREDGTPMRPGEKVSPQRALVLLLKEADESARTVQRCAPVPMYQHEFDAYVSLTYNIGGSAFCRSTIVKRLKTGDYAGACDAILMWDKFQGKPLQGLTNRRIAERDLCLKVPS